MIKNFWKISIYDTDGTSLQLTTRGKIVPRAFILKFDHKASQEDYGGEEKHSSDAVCSSICLILHLYLFYSNISCLLMETNPTHFALSLCDCGFEFNFYRITTDVGRHRSNSS